MTSFAFNDATIWVAGYDFTTDLNQMSISVSADELDSTTFGSGGFRSRKGGLRTVESQLAGFWQSATTAAPDPQAFPNLGVTERVVTVAPDDAEGTTCYMFQAGHFAYQAFGQIGELTPFSLDAKGTNAAGVVRGQVAKAKGNVTATGATGSAVNLGAGSAGTYLYAAVHVFTAGTTLSMKIESDTTSGFASASDVASATVGPLTAAGGTWMTRVDASSITDTWFRFNVTAVTGTFSVAAAIGIGS